IVAAIRLRYRLSGLTLQQHAGLWVVLGEINPRMQWITEIHTGAGGEDFEISTKEPKPKAEKGKKKKGKEAESVEEFWTPEIKAALLACLGGAVHDFLDNGFTDDQKTALRKLRAAALAADPKAKVMELEEVEAEEEQAEKSKKRPSEWGEFWKF